MNDDQSYIFVLEVRRQCRHVAAYRAEIVPLAAGLEHTDIVWQMYRSSQGLLSACALLRRLLYPAPAHRKGGSAQKKKLNELAVRRGQELRAALNVAVDSPLFRIAIRDSLEHYDERLDVLVQKLPLHVQDFVIGPSPKGELLDWPNQPFNTVTLRYIDVVNRVFYVFDDKIELEPLVAEAEEIERACVAWIHQFESKPERGFRTYRGPQWRDEAAT